MSRKLKAALATVLAPDEQPVVETFAQLVQGDAARRAANVGIKFVVAVATGGPGFGAMAATMPELVWVVVTPSRLLMLERPNGPGSCGDLVFDIPLDKLTVSYRSGLRGGVLIDDRASGENLVQLNTGLRKGAAQRVAEAARA